MTNRQVHMNPKHKTKFKKVKWLFGREIEIPEGWKWEKLENNSTLKGRIGWQGLTTAEYLKHGKYYLVTGTDFKNGSIYWENCVYVNKDRYSQDSNIQLKKNDVLVTKDGTIGKVAFVYILSKPATLNSGVFVIRPINKTYFPLFLYYVLRSDYFEKFLDRLKAGSTINHLYQKDFVNFKFPIPSRSEQTRIASILGGVDACIEATQKIIEKYERLKKGLMQHLLSHGINHTKFKKVKWYYNKEIKIPYKWEWSELGNEGSLSSGATPKRDHPKYYNGNILWVSSGELNYNLITTTNELITVLGLQKTNLKIHSEGTFLFAITGLEARGTRGRCAILGRPATINQSCMAFYNSSLDVKFLFYYFLAFGEKIIFATAQGTKQQSLNLEISKKIKIPIPSFSEQQKIASILSGVDAIQNLFWPIKICVGLVMFLILLRVVKL